MKKRKAGRSLCDKRMAALETSVYNVYWVWSMVAYIVFGDLKEAQRLMQNTTNQITDQERMARKSVMKVFTHITEDPCNNVDLFLESAYCFESARDRSFTLTRKLIASLRRRDLLPPDQCDQWEKRLLETY